MSVRLTAAVQQARSIRRRLQRRDTYPTDLAGACGLAALLLAIKLRDAQSFRVGRYYCSRCWHWEDHAWNVIDGHIVDVTASQFHMREAVFVKRAMHAPAYRIRYRGWPAVHAVSTWIYDDWQELVAELAEVTACTG